MDENPILHVVLIEQDALLRWAVAQTLRKAGHTVVEAADATAAEHVLRTATRPVDVVLFDDDTVDWGGVGQLEPGAGRSELGPVNVMMTGGPVADGRQTASSADAAAVITKPFDMDALAGFVLAVWRQAHLAAAACRSNLSGSPARTAP